jgi:hypothetical protein
MQVVRRSGGSTHHVQFMVDDSFIDRLRQLRSLVPSLTAINRQRDLVIDKVRVRLPNAIWRSGAQMDSRVDGSCVVVAAEGFFSCGGKDAASKEKLVTYAFPIARLAELHEQRRPGETLFLRDGILVNDQPSDSPAGRWMALLNECKESGLADPASDFDTLQGVPLRVEQGAHVPQSLHLN